jgi:hypothetical protein
MNRIEINVITGEQKVIELTEQEVNQANKNTEIENNLKLQMIAKQEQELANKQSAMNKLSALGLTEVEIKSILGLTEAELKSIKGL